MLPLRGFLECPDCHRMLTGIASRGRHGNYFHYYHCSGNCKCRFKAAVVNDYFEKELINFQLAPGIGDLYKKIVLDVFQSENKIWSDERKLIAAQIDEQEMILSNACKRFMTEDIDAGYFKAIKSECTEELRILEAKLANMPNKTDSMKTIEGLLDIVIQKYTNIQLHYKTANVIEKRKLIGSMYPKNLCFDRKQHRAPYLNRVVDSILQINSTLGEKNKGERYTNFHLSPFVARKGSFSNPFLEDLRMLAAS